MNYESRSIDIDDIQVGGRLRSLQPEKVAAIAASMAEIGLRTPISVRILDSMLIDGEDVLEVPVLVAGAHRLAAARMLVEGGAEEWRRLDCLLVPANDADALLWEIDENLCRAELSPAQVAEHTARRKSIWEERKAKELGGQTLPTKLRKDGQRAGPQHELGFAADTAAKTGRAKRTINLAVQRGERVAPDVLQRVVGTKLDTGASLDRLAKMGPEEQRKVVEAGGFAPAGSASRTTTDTLHKEDAENGVSPLSSIRELVSDLVAALPAPEDYEQSAQRYLTNTLEEMAGLAAGLYDVLLEVGDFAGASRIAYEFGLPTSAMPLNFGVTFDAIDATGLSKKELSALAGNRNFANHRQEPTIELSMEELYRYRRLLERVGLIPGRRADELTSAPPPASTGVELAAHANVAGDAAIGPAPNDRVEEVAIAVSAPAEPASTHAPVDSWPEMPGFLDRRRLAAFEQSAGTCPAHVVAAAA
jgi:hypothetical protein